GDEDIIGALEGVADGVFGGFGGLAADPRVRSGPEPAGRVTTELELDIGIGADECLGIGVGCEKLHAAQADVDHPLYSVDTAAAGPGNFDIRSGLWEFSQVGSSSQALQPRKVCVRIRSVFCALRLLGQATALQPFSPECRTSAKHATRC